MKKFIFLLLFMSVLFVGATFAETPTSSPPKVDTGDTAWVLIASALVMIMTPGLALFYGGMVRSKNVLGTIMQSFIALGVITDRKSVV
jgi:Amt family ammonium transporter